MTGRLDVDCAGPDERINRVDLLTIRGAFALASKQADEALRVQEAALSEERERRREERLATETAIRRQVISMLMEAYGVVAASGAVPQVGAYD